MNLTKTLLGLLAAATLTAIADIRITSGNLDEKATMQGGTRFRAFNTSSSQQEVYLAKSPAALGTSDRGQMDVTWNSGARFMFGWDPLRNKLFTEVTTTANGTRRLEQNFSIPSDGLLPNFILVSGKDSSPFNNLTMTLENLNGYALDRGFAAGADFRQLSISEPGLLKDGFTMAGSISYTGTPNTNENDKFEIAFGHSDMVPVPEASNYIAAGMLLIPVLVRIHRTLRSNKHRGNSLRNSTGR